MGYIQIRGEVIAINIYIKKRRKTQINNLTLGTSMVTQ